MPALSPGDKAPTFRLTGLDDAHYILTDTLRAEPAVVLAFFKVSCPICQFTFPYLERLHRSYPNLAIWGISQDDKDATEGFCRMFGVTFPVLLDQGFEMSIAYDLTNVPSIFLVGRDFVIDRTIVGFDKEQLEGLNRDLSELAGSPEKALFSAADEVPALKPG